MIDELRRARWFGGKSRIIRQMRVIDRACWADGSTLYMTEVDYTDGRPETYVLADHLEQPAIAAALLRQFGGRHIATAAGGELRFSPTRLFEAIALARAEPIELLRGEQSNTSIRYGDVLMLKLFRRLQYGINPDVEIGRFLTEQTDFRGTPGVAGSLEYLSGDGRQAAVALLQCFEANRGDAWTTMQPRINAVLGVPPADSRESVSAVARLAETTAELHLALARGSGDFSADPISAADVEAWRQAIVQEVQQATLALSRRGIALDSAVLLSRAAGVEQLAGALKIRHHGDYHLGQVLERRDGSFAIIDFEGEPSRPLAQRRQKHAPLRDIAGMLRSFDYARHSAVRSGGATDPERARRATLWYGQVRQQFLEVYARAIQAEDQRLLPADFAAALAALELQKAAYEVQYELNNRPDWVPIPLAALTS